MRNVSSIVISDQIRRCIHLNTKTLQLLDDVFIAITSLIIKQDSIITDRMQTALELSDYMNIEVYFTLVQILDEIVEAKDNTGGTEIEFDRVRFVLECLLQQWKNNGVYEYYNRIVNFRCEALSKERVLN